MLKKYREFSSVRLCCGKRLKFESTTVFSILILCLFILGYIKTNSLPEKVLDNFSKLKMVKIGHFKENIIGFIDGRDASSKLTVMNVKTNQVVHFIKRIFHHFSQSFFLMLLLFQVIYQSQSLKLLESYSFNEVLPIIGKIQRFFFNLTFSH